VANIVVGARNEKQLRENLGAVGWTLEVEHLKILDDASRRPPVYPYWHQMGFDERDPKPTSW
jgi:aryl-alcohol dehydrogenase-like predicted oxidoreductase